MWTTELHEALRRRPSRTWRRSSVVATVSSPGVSRGSVFVPTPASPASADAEHDQRSHRSAPSRGAVTRPAGRAGACRAPWRIGFSTYFHESAATPMIAASWSASREQVRPPSPPSGVVRTMIGKCQR